MMSSFRAKAFVAVAALAIGWPAGAQPGASIVISELDAVDSFSVEALPAGVAALPTDIWAGVAGADAARVVGASPGGHGSLAAAEISARVLLTGAAAPERREGRALALARVRAVAELGRLGAVDRILSGAPKALEDADFARFGAAAKLANNDVAGACSLSDRLSTGRREAYWARLRAACFAMAGESAAAELTLELAREAAAEGVDEDFSHLVAAAGGALDGDRPATLRDTIELALARKAGVAITAEAARDLTLGAAAAIALDETVPAATRLVAAQRAAEAGAIGVAALAAAYEAATPPDDRPAAEILEAAYAAEGAQQAALVHAAVAQAEEPEVRAEAVALALERAEGAAAFIIAARLHIDTLRALAPGEATLGYAPLFAEAAAAAGDPALGRAWLTARVNPTPSGPARLTSVAEAEAEPVAPSLDPVDRTALEALLTAADASLDGGALEAVARSRLDAAAGGTAPEQDAARRDAMLLLALGARNSSGLRRAAALAAADSPDPGPDARAALFVMDAAADANSLAETALSAAQAVAATGPRDIVTVSRAVRALWKVRLDDEARALAVEAMIAARRGE